MIRGIVVSACLAGAVGVAPGDEKEQDPIKEKLFAARVAYDTELKQYRKLAGEWFDKREEVARKDGNKKLVDQIKEERKAFDETGDLPKVTPTSVQQKPALAKKALEAAYAQAVKDYIKAKKDDQAVAVEAEWKEFRTKVLALNPRPEDVKTKEDLQKYLSDTVWVWGDGLKLKPGGNTEQKEWESRGLVTRWEVVDRRTVVLWIEKGRDINRTATLVFVEDLSEFKGFDFGGNRMAIKRKP